MNYLKEYNEFNQYVNLDCGLLDIMTGKVVNSDADYFYIYGDIDDFDLSDNDKNIIDKYYLSIKDLIIDDINFELIEIAKDLSLEYLDDYCELVIHFYLKDTTPNTKLTYPEYRLFELQYSHNNYKEFYPRLFKEKYDKVLNAKERNKYTINKRAYYSYSIFIYKGRNRVGEYEENIIRSLKDEFSDYDIIYRKRKTDFPRFLNL
jgi:hypothetical protein